MQIALKMCRFTTITYFTFSRSISDVSINSNTATSTDPDHSYGDLDNELDTMGRVMEQIEQSVGETAQSYLPHARVYERTSKSWYTYKF